MKLLLAMAILGIGWLAIRKMAVMNPADVKKNLRRAGGVFAIALALFLVLRGALPIAIPIFLFGAGLLGLEHLVGIQAPWGNNGGPDAQMQTSVLLVQLDQKSGKMSGEVLSGQLAGSQLEDLSLRELVGLFDDCIAARDQSPMLLEAYLDAQHPQWRQKYDTEHYGSNSNQNASKSGEMDTKEALAILGLPSGATEKQITTAHRSLMKKYHPDQGGSDYLAMKINEAKDVLIS